MPTRAEIIEGEKDKVFRCAGPLRLSPEQQATGYRKARALVKEGNVEELVQLIRDLNVAMRVLGDGYELWAKLENRTATLDDLGEALGLLLEARTACGEDVRPLHLAAAFDGREHKAPCPKCGTIQEWTAPLADEERDAAAAADAAALAKALS